MTGVKNTYHWSNFIGINEIQLPDMAYMLIFTHLGFSVPVKQSFLLAHTQLPIDC